MKLISRFDATLKEFRLYERGLGKKRGLDAFVTDLINAVKKRDHEILKTVSQWTEAMGESEVKKVMEKTL